MSDHPFFFTWTAQQHAKPLALTGGQGAWFTTADGGRWLDLGALSYQVNAGHGHPRIAAAIKRQADELCVASPSSVFPAKTALAEKLLALAGPGFSKVFFCLSGAEANENAMRIARSVTGKKNIVVAEGGFHGRTAAAIAATGLKYRKNLSGLGADIVHVPFGDLAAAEKALEGAAGFLLEPIQSVQGCTTATNDYLKGLEALCKKSGALLIFDEVQTGMGRVGAPSARHAFGARPHMQTFAKALASGVPAGAVLVAPEAAAKVKPGELGSTFGGGPLACVAISATLKTIVEKNLAVNAAEMEDLIRMTFKFPQIVEIRGKGLLLGLVLDRPSKAVRDALLQKKIIVGGADDKNVIRLLPPLTVGPTEIGLLRGALEEIFASETVAA